MIGYENRRKLGPLFTAVQSRTVVFRFRIYQYRRLTVCICSSLIVSKHSPRTSKALNMIFYRFQLTSMIVIMKMMAIILAQMKLIFFILKIMPLWDKLRLEKTVLLTRIIPENTIERSNKNRREWRTVKIASCMRTTTRKKLFIHIYLVWIFPTTVKLHYSDTRLQLWLVYRNYFRLLRTTNTFKNLSKTEKHQSSIAR